MVILLETFQWWLKKQPRVICEWNGWKRWKGLHQICELPSLKVIVVYYRL